MTSHPRRTLSTSQTSADEELRHLEQLADRLTRLGVASRLRKAWDTPPVLVVISPTDSCLNESVTCEVVGGQLVWRYSWGDPIGGDTLDEIATSVLRVVGTDPNGNGV